VEERPADLKAKTKLENLGLKISNWSVIVWGPTGMVYDLTREMFDERRDEIVELLERGPPGPCGI
jgi:hypothetical protein